MENVSPKIRVDVAGVSHRVAENQFVNVGGGWILGFGSFGMWIFSDTIVGAPNVKSAAIGRWSREVC